MSKKAMILIVIVECILAILLIAVIGKAVESYYYEVGVQEIYFVTDAGERIESGASIKLDRTDRGYQLHYEIVPSDTTDKSVTFRASKPDLVEVDETGYVTFFEDVDVSITVTTKNGKSATVVLVPKRDTSGEVVID